MQTAPATEKWAHEIVSLARIHACSRHALFAALADSRLQLTARRAGLLLRNYDAHASLLRRLLLKASTLMPEPAVGYILENVRNEYGNGNYAANHQEQLREVARAAGCSTEKFLAMPIMPGIRRFLQKVSRFYYPVKRVEFSSLLKPAIAAGAITATELLAVEEFRALHRAFTGIGCGDHVWFNHVLIEQEHTDESVALALYFAQKHQAFEAVKVGLEGVLDANVDLYDGLLEALETA